MTSQARIDANRRNAEKSTGPKTEAGKEKVRLNALSHGLSAETVVLPHEDAAAFEKRRAAWTRELSPGGSSGDYLAERAAKLSWQLDRADKAEHAQLAKRVREIPRERERSRRRRAAEQVRMILEPDPVVPADRPKRTRAERLERLESTAHGCRALLEAWAALEGELSATDGGAATAVGDRLVRLLGAADLVDATRSADPRLRRIAGIADEARTRRYMAIFEDPQGPRPDDTAACVALLEVVAEEQRRLMDLLEEREEDQPDLVAEDAARVAFDTSKEAEVVHRYQNQWGRALLQTFKAIAALRPTLAVEPSAERAGEAAVETATDQAAPEQSQRGHEKANETKELGQGTGGWSRSGRGMAECGRTGSEAVAIDARNDSDAGTPGHSAVAA